jgi:hypothetical protein
MKCCISNCVCLQGELFAQSILDQIAEVMPSHAMADIAVSQRAGSHDSDSPGSYDPRHVSEGGVAARALANLPPSIAEEGKSPAASLDGSKGGPAGQACVGCQDGSIPGIGGPTDSTAAAAAATGSACGISSGGACGISSGGCSVSGSDGSSKSGCGDRAVGTMDVQVLCELKGSVEASPARSSGGGAGGVDSAAGGWGSQGSLVQQYGDGSPGGSSGVWRQGSSGGIELSIPTASEPVIGLGPVSHR